MSQVRSVTHLSGLDNGFDGSPGRTRTCDPPVNSRLLYQLSYRGSDHRWKEAANTLGRASAQAKGLCAQRPHDRGFALEP